MSKLIPGNNKHLTIDDRLYIEQALDQGVTFTDIARYLCKDPTTISKEILRHRRINTWNRGVSITLITSAFIVTTARRRMPVTS